MQNSAVCRTLAQGVDINQADKRGKTALYLSAQVRGQAMGPPCYELPT